MSLLHYFRKLRCMKKKLITFRYFRFLYLTMCINIVVHTRSIILLFIVTLSTYCRRQYLILHVYFNLYLSVMILLVKKKQFKKIVLKNVILYFIRFKKEEYALLLNKRNINNSATQAEQGSVSRC
jgi:hypothetical protein